MAPARSSCKDHLERISPEFTMKTQQAKSLRTPRRTLSASRDAVEMHMDVSQKQFYARIYRKNATCRERDKFVRACAIEIICRSAHGHITKAIARGNLQEKIRKNAGAQDHENPAAQTLCDPQQSKCTWISREATFM